MKTQRGTVILIVLWTAALIAVLVTAMAGEVRLAAQTVRHNHDAALRWAELMGVLRQTEAEIMLEQMQRPVGLVLEETVDGEVRTPIYRFNGQPLNLHYPKVDDIVVRVFNHAGKINLNRISPQNLRLLIQNLLGGVDADLDRVDELMASWVDWTDLNDLVNPDGGAERDYYESLEPGYLPRNNAELDTVEEVLYIKGFAELLAGVDLDAAFTVYGNDRQVNLNLATREAMRLLPGMTEEIMENIIAFRQREDINNRAEIAEIVPFENLQELSSWLGNNVSTYYSVFVYHAAEPQDEAEDNEDRPGRQGIVDRSAETDPVTQAYSEIIEVRSYDQLPTVMEVDPYGRLPDTAPARVDERDLLFAL